MPEPTVTIETNAGGALLVAAVRHALEDLPVRVLLTVRTRPRKARRG